MYTIGDSIYMQINTLPAGGAVVVVGSAVSPVTLYTTAALSDITCNIKWKWHPQFSENSWFPSEIKFF